MNDGVQAVALDVQAVRVQVLCTNGCLEDGAVGVFLYALVGH